VYSGSQPDSLGLGRQRGACPIDYVISTYPARHGQEDARRVGGRRPLDHEEQKGWAGHRRWWHDQQARSTIDVDDLQAFPWGIEYGDWRSNEKRTPAHDRVGHHDRLSVRTDSLLKGLGQVEFRGQQRNGVVGTSKRDFARKTLLEVGIFCRDHEPTECAFEARFRGVCFELAV
jgi:hypothetical protein